MNIEWTNLAWCVAAIFFWTLEHTHKLAALRISRILDSRWSKHGSESKGSTFFACWAMFSAFSTANFKANISSLTTLCFGNSVQRVTTSHMVWSSVQDLGVYSLPYDHCNALMTLMTFGQLMTTVLRVTTMSQPSNIFSFDYQSISHCLLALRKQQPSHILNWILNTVLSMCSSARSKFIANPYKTLVRNMNAAYSLLT